MRLVRRSFDDIFENPVWRGLKPGHGQRVRRYLDDFHAEIEDDDGGAEIAIATSSLPLQTRTAGGERVPVDLGLEAVDDAFEPRAALVPTRIAKRAEDGVMLGSAAIGVRPAAGGGTVGTLTGDRLFYPDVGGAAEDTDLVIEPDDLGAEFMWQLRSAHSPERHSLALELPQGAKLRRSELVPGAAEIVHGQKALAFVDPPTALDSDGTSVPVSYELEDDTLTAKVDHRGADLHYPLLVDPGFNVMEDFYNGNWIWSGWWAAAGGSFGMDGWIYPANTAGLSLWGKYQVTYQIDDYIGWYWQAPRNAFIYRADFTSLSWQRAYWPGSPSGCNSKAQHGLWRGSPWSGWEGSSPTSIGAFHQDPHCEIDKPDYGLPAICAAWDCDPNAGTEQNRAVQALSARRDGSGNSGVAGMKRTVLYLRDRFRPRVLETDHSQNIDDALGDGRWLPAGVNMASRPKGTDWGLGIARFELVQRVTARKVTTHAFGCTAPAAHDTDSPPGGYTDPGHDTGDRHLRCNAAQTAPYETPPNDQTDSVTLGYSTDQLDEGTHTYGVDAYDIIGTTSEPSDSTWTLKVDRTRPSVSIGDGAVKAGAKLAAGEHELIVNGSDVGASGAENSGIKRFRWWIDGSEQAAAQKDCSSGPCDHTFTLDTTATGLSEGRHDIAVAAEDGVGLVSPTATFRVIVDRSDPDAAALSGPLHDEVLLKGMSYGLHVEARDGTPPPSSGSLPNSAVRAGVQMVQLVVDGVERGRKEQIGTCPDGNCPLPADLAFDAGQTKEPDLFREGRQNVKVVIEDLLGHQRVITRRQRPGDPAETDWQVIVDRSDPEQIPSGDVWEARDTTLGPGLYDLRVEGKDGAPDLPETERSGVDRVEIFVDGERVVLEEAPAGCEESCPVTADWTLDTREFGNGEHRVRAVTTDNLGHDAEEEWTVELDDRTGFREYYDFDAYELNGNLTAQVNMGSGNLLLTERDLRFEDSDLPYDVERSYSALSTRSTPTGLAWDFAPGSDARLVEDSDGSVRVFGPSGYVKRFARNGEGEYVMPHGLSAELTKVQEDGTYTLRWLKNDDLWQFDSAGYLTSRSDEDGGRVSYQRDAQHRVSSITDTEDRTISFTYDSDGYVATMTHAGAQYSYDHDSNGNLTSATTPSGATTVFAYAGTGGRLSQVTHSDGVLTRFAYDDFGRVTSLTRVHGTEVSTTAYTYELGRVIVTEPGGRQRIHAHGRALDSNGQAGTAPPELTLTGTLWDARGGEIANDTTYTLSAEATDGSGIERLEMYIDRRREELEKQACADPCGPLSATWELDSDELMQGEYLITVVATDGSGESRTQSFGFIRPALPPVEEPDEGEEPADDSEFVEQSFDACYAHYGIGSPSCADADPFDDQPEEEGGTGLQAAANRLSDLVFGIADEKADVWNDPNRPATGVRTVRRIVSYNIMETEDPNNDDDEVDRFRAFYDANPNAQIMVSFQFKCHPNSDCYGGADSNGDNGPAERQAYAPHRKEYVDWIRKFANEFSRVRIFSAWNEPNHSTQPFGFSKRGPKKAALRTHWLQRWVCNTKRKCTVVAGDVWQKHNSFVKWVRIYRDELKRLNGSRPMPRFWATHPYTDVWNTDPPYGPGEADREVRRSLTNKFITAAGSASRIWLNEVGARITSRIDETDQRRQAEYLTDELATQRRIDRVYWYFFCNTEQPPSPDTGLTAPSGGPSCGAERPALPFYRTRVQAGRNPGRLPYDP